MANTPRTTVRQRAEAVAEAHTNLTVFHAVRAILEGGTLYGTRPQRAAQRISDLCDKAARAELAAMDKAVEALDAR